MEKLRREFLTNTLVGQDYFVQSGVRDIYSSLLSGQSGQYTSGYSSTTKQIPLNNPDVKIHVPTVSKLLRWICIPRLKSPTVTSSITFSENALYYLDKCWMLCWNIHIHFFILSFWNSKHTLSLHIKVLLPPNVNLPCSKEKKPQLLLKEKDRKKWTRKKILLIIMQIVVVKSSDASCTKGATFKIKTLVQLFTDLNLSWSSDINRTWLIACYDCYKYWQY